MAELTLNDLIMTIARRYGNAANGTATGGTTTTLVDTAGLFHPDHTWANFYLYQATGANAGVERLVTDSVQSTKTLSLDPALSNVVAAAVEYQVLPIQRQYFVDAINEAIRRADDTWMQVKQDESLSLSTAQEYTLPSDLILLLGVYIGIPGNTVAWSPYTGYEVIMPTAGTPKLHLRNIPQPFTIPTSSNTTIRLIYAANPSMLTTGAGTLGIGEPMRGAISFIQEMALHLLHEQAVARNVTGEAARAHLTLAQQHLDKAREIKGTVKPSNIQRRMRTRVLPQHI
jgi:hypothetical protein